jgi:hypothetical protein
MDVNCGTILDGEESVQQCGQRIFELMLKTASGQPTKSESFDFGGAESRPGCLGRRCEMSAVIPGRCKASNPESRDSGFALRAPRNDGW